MILNSWKLTVDEAFRLSVPVNLPPEIENYFGESVILAEGDDGCIRIYKTSAAKKLQSFEPIFEVKVKKKTGRNLRGHETRRIQIPSELRRALSFLYGRTISLAQCPEGSLMLWPRPSPN